jgi:hypothetical protein
VDATDALFAGLPLMLSVLLALVLVFFTVAMRSVVLAVKATLLVVVSLGASVGVLLALSTTDTGARLIGWVAARGPPPDRTDHDRGDRDGPVHRLRGHPPVAHPRDLPGDRGQHPGGQGRRRPHRARDQQRGRHHDRRSSWASPCPT